MAMVYRISSFNIIYMIIHSILVITAIKPLSNVFKELLEHENYNAYSVDNINDGLLLLKSKKISMIIYDFNEINWQTLFELLSFNSITIPLLFVFDKNDKKSIEKFNVDSRISEIIIKPVDIPLFFLAVRNVLKEVERKANEIQITTNIDCTTDRIIGNSPQIEHVKKMIRVLAKSKARILINGDNGTGKELVAKCLHELGDRRAKPMVEVNCAAIPKELIESEMFGHEKGSFTSALKQRKGKFELATGSTLFLDEIGDMSLSAQAKVLRALQENKITRVGGDEEIKVDVRVIAATNKDLQQEIKNGNFREDLYHRLSVVQIIVPPLNERRSDIPLLVDHFIKEICEDYKIPIKSIDSSAIDILKNKSWTGNIRELHNIVERLIIFSDEIITIDTVNTYVFNKMN